MTEDRNARLPELLAPAGSAEALYAAVSAGADAVYFGVGAFNARMNAKNLAEGELAEATAYCRRLGVKTYVTLNTQLYGGEVYAAAETARGLYNLGVDAFITADIGLARILRSVYPEIEIHASTQMTGQNEMSAQVLSEMGFSRMVAPRELSLADIKALCEKSPIETEIFIHGALCVSASGQCLFSSVIGGRSGNRGQCAQPCRLPYSCGKGQGYPLSLKDLCLASHMEELISSGVASLKIEGRMKSADYVYGVVKIYRRLLDEGRNATADELEALARLFSRSGFTDGYFTGKIDSSMLGVRTEDDKRASTAQGGGKYIGERRLPLLIRAEFYADRPPMLHGTAYRGGEEICVSVAGENAPNADYPAIPQSRIEENLTKFGATIYRAQKTEITGAENAHFPLSEINALRRTLCGRLDAAALGEREPLEKRDMPKAVSEPKTAPERKINFVSGKTDAHGKTAYFVYADSITEAAKAYFGRIYVPLMQYVKLKSPAENIGVAFPPVVFSHECAEVIAAAEKAAEIGCRYALITNLWQVATAKRLGFEACGDLRLGICNGESAAEMADIGLERFIVSSEARKSPAAVIPRGQIIYGALPVMTLEKCAIREICGAKLPPISACRYCDTHRFSYLCDRLGVKFPMAREYKHRNVIFNSVPVYMGDKKSGMDCEFYHYIFTNESCAEIDRIIGITKEGKNYGGKFCRLSSPK